MAIVFAPLKILDEVATDVYNSTKRAISITRDVFIRNMEIGFSAYIAAKYERYSKVHTLLSPNVPINVEDIYINPKFDYKNQIVLGENAINFVIDRQILVVQAIAGHGKSMFVRELFCRLCNVNYGLIPIFLELRDIDFELSNVIEAAHEELSAKSTLFSRSSFEALVKSGKVLFLLDGFDEIRTNARKLALRKIDQVTRDFPTAKVVVTSRPTDIFNGWSPATIVTIKETTTCLK
ncbi:NACHT domain-containing protein [Mesorhizobium sp. B2-4-14]|uniref:NACHT domain-containing protein n=1 Tax=Mesorhizobium sp. B2-4-14 TaxID=2589935 RepID=UPI00112CE9FC|nr:NACHT domain-containing protein [Mesorhizobium sp. B2-4-14]TPK96826.1 NACHT domain-containing protein [Mesorhizobium sp. B2-4-14]